LFGGGIDVLNIVEPTLNYKLEPVFNVALPVIAKSTGEGPPLFVYEL